MRKKLAILAGLAMVCGLVLASGGAAMAGFKVCNKSDERVNVSIGYNSKDFGWTSEGWWAADPGECTTILKGDLDKRYIYVFAVGAKDGVWEAEKDEQEGGFFCVGKAKYTFHNSDFQKGKEINCEASGQTTKQFLEVDTKDADEFTYDLED